MISRIAWRNIWRNKKRTVITIAPIALGLAFAIFFVSIEDGLRDRLENDAVQFMAGHITLEHPAYQDEPAIDIYLTDTEQLRVQIEERKDVKRTKLLVIARGVAKSSVSSMGVKIFGVEPSAEKQTSPLVSQMTAGRYLQDRDNAHIVIGRKLAERLGTGVGKKLVLTTTDTQSMITDVLCRIVGVFETGLEEVDSYIVHIPLLFAREILYLPQDSATQLSVILSRSEAGGRLIQEIKALTAEKPIAVYSWHSMVPELASLIQMIRYSVVILEGLLILLILFTILNTILMSVVERRKEFAVLLALGTPPGFLKRKIFLESAWIALHGVVLGTIMGGLISLAFQIWGLDLNKIIGTDQFFFGFGTPSLIYPRVQLGTLLKMGGIVLAAVLAISLIPMRWAVKVPIAETIRLEKP